MSKNETPIILEASQALLELQEYLDELQRIVDTANVADPNGDGIYEALRRLKNMLPPHYSTKHHLYCASESVNYLVRDQLIGWLFKLGQSDVVIANRSGMDLSRIRKIHEQNPIQL